MSTYKMRLNDCITQKPCHKSDYIFVHYILEHCDKPKSLDTSNYIFSSRPRTIHDAIPWLRADILSRTREPLLQSG